MTAFRSVRRLEEIATFERDTVTPEAISNGTMYVGLEHIDSEGDFVDVKDVRAGELASNKFRFSEQHILFGKLRPYLKKTARPNFEGICSTDILPILPGEEVDRDYLFHFLRHPKTVQEAVLRCAGANLPRISPRDLATLEIPIPPLVEQRRIADILDKTDGIRRKRSEAIALTEDLLRSAFLEMFGDPVTNSKKWPLKPLGDVLERLDAGWSANGDARVREDDEYGVLKVSAVTSGVFRPEEHKAVSASAIDRELVTPRAGDLLFSRANTRDLVAATCLVERDEPRLFLPDKLWRVVPRSKVSTSAYLRFLLAHDRFRSELTKTATGTSGSMLNVSMEKLRGLRGPFPPFELQEEFSTLVWKALKLKSQHETAHALADDLFNSLVARAFSGSLGAPC